MKNPLSILKDMQHKVEELIGNSPAKDLQEHIKSLMNNTFNKLDLVTREEFDIQKQVLEHTRQKLEVLEKQLDDLLASFHESLAHDKDKINKKNKLPQDVH